MVDVDWYAEHEKLEMSIGDLQFLRNMVEVDLRKQIEKGGLAPDGTMPEPSQMVDMQGRYILLDAQVAIVAGMTALANVLLRESL